MKHYNFTTVITQEGPYYIARCLELGVVSQGSNIEEAMNNLREAASLYLEDAPAEALLVFANSRPLVSTLELEYA